MTTVQCEGTWFPKYTGGRDSNQQAQGQVTKLKTEAFRRICFNLLVHYEQQSRRFLEIIRPQPPSDRILGSGIAIGDGGYSRTTATRSRPDRMFGPPMKHAHNAC